MPISRRDWILAGAAAALEASCAPLEPPGCWKSATPGHLPPAPLPVPLVAERCELSSFDGIRSATPTVYRPQTDAEIAALLTKSAQAGRKVTFRGGGQSLDDQSLNQDLVISTEAFSHIGDVRSDAQGFYIRTGAGALWWDVLLKVSELGLMPPSLVTAGRATVGGTMSADCVSRMSPIAGKEGNQIRSFDIVLPNGGVQTVDRAHRQLPPSDLRHKLWYGVIGGFGYLGAVTSVTFDLMVARSKPGICAKRPNVLTRSTRHGQTPDWDTVLRALHSKSRAASAAYKANKQSSTGVQLANTPDWAALSIASFLTGSSMTANLLEQRFVETDELRPVPAGLYDRNSPAPAIAEGLIATWPTAVEIGLDMGFPEGEFIDELFGWAFFLGNSASGAKEKLRLRGTTLNFTQQTWVIPSGSNDDRPDTAPTRRFVELIQARLHAVDWRPADIDFLWVPGDEFTMSASRNLSGYVVTISFADKNRTSLAPEIDWALRQLSRDCRGLGGRVHLVKNVVADPADLRAMHGDAALSFRALKREVDPGFVIRNDFFTRVFEA